MIICISQISFAAIARVGSQDTGLDTGLSGTTATIPYTCGSGSNRLLVVGFFGSAGIDTVTSVTYDGAAMTRIATDQGIGDRRIWMYYILNPTGGSSKNIVITFSLGPDHTLLFAADYTGVLQSAQPDASNSHNSTGAATLNVDPTVVNSNCWIVSTARDFIGSGTTWSGLTALRTSGGLNLADTNTTVPTGTYTGSVSNSSSGLSAIISASFQPDTGGGVTTPVCPSPFCGIIQ